MGEERKVLTRRGFLKLAGAGVLGLVASRSIRSIENQNSQFKLDVYPLGVGISQVELELFRSEFSEIVQVAKDLKLWNSDLDLPQVVIANESSMRIGRGNGASVDVRGIAHTADEVNADLLMRIEKNAGVKCDFLVEGRPIILLSGQLESDERSRVFGHELIHIRCPAKLHELRSYELTCMIDDYEYSFSYGEGGLIKFTYTINGEKYISISPHLPEIVAGLGEEKIYQAKLRMAEVPLKERHFAVNGPNFPYILVMLGVLDEFNIKHEGRVIEYDELLEILTKVDGGVRGLIDFAQQNTEDQSSENLYKVKVAILASLCRLGKYRGAGQYLGKFGQ